MLFIATFSNISAISCGTVLLVEEIGVPREIIDLSQVTDKLYHIKLHPAYLAKSGVRTHNISGDRHRLHLKYILSMMKCM